MIGLTVSGSLSKTEAFLRSVQGREFLDVLHEAGRKGVDALAANTPVKTGETAASWGYSITTSKNGYRLDWVNYNVVSGFPIAIGLQYGHGTGSGGWVEGEDYINPAMKPIFEQIISDLRRELSRR